MLKKLLVVSLLLIPSASFAWECPQNPDRFPSVGLTYTGISESGQYKTLGFSQDVSTLTGALVLDTRLPLSNSFTLSVGLGATGSAGKADENPAFSGAKTDTSGGLFTIAGRYYFNH